MQPAPILSMEEESLDLSSSSLGSINVTASAFSRFSAPAEPRAVSPVEQEARASVAGILLQHGRQLLAKHFYVQARQSLERCRNLLEPHDPVRPRVLHALAEADEATGDFYSAIWNLQEALTVQLLHGDERLFLSRLWEQLARLQHQTGDYDEAMDSCFEALKLRPDGASLQLLQNISQQKQLQQTV